MIERVGKMTFNKFITSASDLVTTHEATRAGFLSIALEKNRVSDPYVKIALCFKTRVTGVISLVKKIYYIAG